MKLSVSSWYPYRHQATALLQFLGSPDWACVDLAGAGDDVVGDSFGAFLALTDPRFERPLVGVPAIVEAMHREDTDRGLLPSDPVARALSRALAGRIEECLTRLAVADIGRHADFSRPIWQEGSPARAAILDDYPARIATLESFQQRADTRCMAGDRPSLADCLMAALWWTAEDQGLDHALREQPSLMAWHEANCAGAPFART